jgi:Carboxypeptidase regulatory-like domain
MRGLFTRGSWNAALGAPFVFVLPFLATFVCAQGPATPPPSSSQTQSSSSSPYKAKKQNYTHADDFLILGTVFDERGWSFPAVQLRIRRSNEKKFRWDTLTNSRGEFAIRVPKGSDYEMIVHAKGFADQTRPLNAKTGLSEARLVFRMEPVAGEKK